MTFLHGKLGPAGQNIKFPVIAASNNWWKSYTKKLRATVHVFFQTQYLCGPDAVDGGGILHTATLAFTDDDGRKWTAKMDLDDAEQFAKSMLADIADRRMWIAEHT